MDRIEVVLFPESLKQVKSRFREFLTPAGSQLSLSQKVIVVSLIRPEVQVKRKGRIDN